MPKDKSYQQLVPAMQGAQCMQAWLPEGSAQIKHFLMRCALLHTVCSGGTPRDGAAASPQASNGLNGAAAQQQEPFMGSPRPQMPDSGSPLASPTRSGRGF